MAFGTVKCFWFSLQISADFTVRDATFFNVKRFGSCVLEAVFFLNDYSLHASEKWCKVLFLAWAELKFSEACCLRDKDGWGTWIRRHGGDENIYF